MEYKGRNETQGFEKITTISVTNNDFSISDKFADTPFEIEYKILSWGLKEYVKADPKVFCI
jgi:hypothetical protein